MLIKKIYIMKGVGTAKSVLKVALLENGYSEIDLQTHFAYGDNYTFILKSGNFIHVEAMKSKGLKRKLQPFSLDDLCTGIAKDGKIIMWCANTPTVPYCLVELAQKYTTIKSRNLLEDARNKPSPNESNDVEIMTSSDNNANAESEPEEPEQSENTTPEQSENSDNIFVFEQTQNADNSETVNSPEPKEKPEVKDITQDFNILTIENDDFNENSEEVESGYSMAKEIEEKYASFPHNEVLENVFPGSKWILTETDDFSLGILYNSEKITHICYAKRGEKDSSFDHNASYYDGWWVVINDNV